MVRRCLLTIAIVVCLSVGSKAFNCEYGEAIICRDYESAKSCGMLERCSDLWRRANILMKSPFSSQCQVCQHLLLNDMHDNLSNLLSRSAKSILFSSNDTKALYANVSDTDFTCTLMKMCNTTFTLPTLRFNRSDVCDDCKHIIDDVRILIEDQATKTAVATYFKAAFCIRLPLQIVDICKHTIDSYIGVIMDLVASKLESQKTCAFFGLCPNTVSVKLGTQCPKTQVYSWIKRPGSKGYAMWHSRLTLKDESHNCTDCVKVFSRIRDVSKDKSFDVRFKAIIVDRICRSFGIMKQLCSAIISKEVDELMQESSKANVKDICIFFEQCQGTLSSYNQSLIGGVDTLFSTRSKDVGFPVICEFCEALIKQILDATVNNRTEEAIIAALKEICDLFPKPQCVTCKTYIDYYGKWIVNAIISGTAPKVICMRMGLCWPWDRHVAAPQGILPIPMGTTGVPCLICNALTTMVYSKLHQNSTVAAIERDLESFCIYAPSAEDLCRKQVKKYTPIVIELFINGLPESDVCKVVKVCSDEPDDDVPNSSSEGCSVCEIVIGFIKSQIEANDTIDIIDKKLESVCDYIPYVEYKEKCHEYVKAYSKELIKYLVDNVSTRGICEKLGFCSKSIKKKVALTDEQACTICTQIIQYIYTEISDKNTVAEITQVLEYVCHVLPPGLQNKCQRIVEQYTPQLIELLVNKVPPKKICQELGICSLVVETQDQLTCTVCTEIIQYIYSKIEDKSNEDAIRRALESVCDSIPFYKDQCHYYVKTYTDKLIQMLLDELTPKEICQKLGFCPLAAKDRVPLSDNQVCTICVEIIDYIEDKIKDNRTEDKIEELLESVCDYIPFYKKECHAIVKEHAKELIQMLLNELSPKKICQELGACESDEHIKALCRGGSSAWCRNVRSAELCNQTAFCQEFIWYHPNYPNTIASGSVQLYNCAKLTNLVERCRQEQVAKLCGLSITECAPLRAFGESRQDPSCSFCRKVLGVRIVSGAVGLNCSIYVTDREREHCEQLKLLSLPGRLSWENLDGICKAENMCDNQLVESKPKWIVGDDPCIWGTSVVCQSMDNADRCGQVEFCQREVWKGLKPPLRQSRFNEDEHKKTPGIQLVDCELPLDKLCGSPNLRFCGVGVHRRCTDFIKLKIETDSSSEMDTKVKNAACQRSRFTLCSDRKLMEVCGVERYCEAMGLTPSTLNPKSELPKECLNGPAFYCQSYANAKLCKTVALCRAQHWL